MVGLSQLILFIFGTAQPSQATLQPSWAKTLNLVRIKININNGHKLLTKVTWTNEIWYTSSTKLTRIETEVKAEHEDEAENEVEAENEDKD